MLSAMQQRIYDYIAACIQTQGYPPSVREIGEAVGLRSPSTVHFHLKKLADAGVIEIGAGKGRAITLTHPAAPSVPEPEEPAQKTTGLNPALLLAVLALMGGGGAFAYFKFIKGKANHKNSSNPDDYDYEDGEELPDEEDIELEDEESDELDADRGGGEESEDETP